MPVPPVAADLTSVVVTGNFRPVMISPHWLRDNDLIGDAELQKTKFELLIPQEAAIFESGWFRCQANPQVLEFQTRQESEFERLRDLMVNVLRELSDAPKGQMGINRVVHYKLDSQSAWHTVGNNLVHNEIWRGVLHLAGMRSVVYWGTRTDGYSGRVQVQVEPSFQYPSGIHLAYNDHYDLGRVERIPAERENSSAAPADSEFRSDKTETAIEILLNNWSESMNLFDGIVDRVFSEINDGRT